MKKSLLPFKNSLLKKRIDKRGEEKTVIIASASFNDSSSTARLFIIELFLDRWKTTGTRTWWNFEKSTRRNEISESLFVRVILWPFSNHVLYNFLIHVRESMFVQLFLEIIIFFFFFVFNSTNTLSFSFSL